VFFFFFIMKFFIISIIKLRVDLMNSKVEELEKLYQKNKGNEFNKTVNILENT